MYELCAEYDIVFCGWFIGVCHRRGRDSQGVGACIAGFQHLGGPVSNIECSFQWNSWEIRGYIGKVYWQCFNVSGLPPYSPLPPTALPLPAAMAVLEPAAKPLRSPCSISPLPSLPPSMDPWLAGPPLQPRRGCMATCGDELEWLACGLSQGNPSFASFNAAACHQFTTRPLNFPIHYESTQNLNLGLQWTNNSVIPSSSLFFFGGGCENRTMNQLLITV
jgi:hypothetical protein